MPEARLIMGRPPRKARKPNELVSLGGRIRPEIKEKLDNAAMANGRSQSHQLEFFIENAFRDIRLLDEAADLAYGRINAGILLGALAEILRAADDTARSHNVPRWFERPATYMAVMIIESELWSAFRIPGKEPAPQAEIEADLRSIREKLRLLKNNREWGKRLSANLGVYAKLIFDFVEAQERKLSEAGVSLSGTGPSPTGGPSDVSRINIVMGAEVDTEDPTKV